MLALLFNHLGSSSSSVRSDPRQPRPLPLEDYVFWPNRNTRESSSSGVQQEREGPGGGTAGTVARWQAWSERMAEPWGKVNKAGGEDAGAQKEKPDQEVVTRGAKLESLP